MFSFVTVTRSTSAVTRSMSGAGDRRHETAFGSDRRLPPMEDANAWPVSAAGVALTNAKNLSEREDPWRHRLTGVGFILGLALRGLMLPVGL
jgi:hypothetical protein